MRARFKGRALFKGEEQGSHPHRTNQDRPWDG